QPRVQADARHVAAMLADQLHVQGRTARGNALREREVLEARPPVQVDEKNVDVAFREGATERREPRDFLVDELGGGDRTRVDPPLLLREQLPEREPRLR